MKLIVLLKIILYLDKKQRSEKYLWTIFERIDISDHLKDYMIEILEISESLESALKFDFEDERIIKRCLKKGEMLKELIGLNYLNKFNNNLLN